MAFGTISHGVLLWAALNALSLCLFASSRSIVLNHDLYQLFRRFSEAISLKLMPERHACQLELRSAFRSGSQSQLPCHHCTKG